MFFFLCFLIFRTLVFNIVFKIFYDCFNDVFTFFYCIKNHKESKRLSKKTKTKQLKIK